MDITKTGGIDATEISAAKAQQIVLEELASYVEGEGFTGLCVEHPGKPYPQNLELQVEKLGPNGERNASHITPSDPDLTEDGIREHVRSMADAVANLIEQRGEG